MNVTPLHKAHIGLGARMAPFGGYDMPIQYEGIIAEHNATRTAATVFDTCHMGRFMIDGPSCISTLSSLLTLDAGAMAAGRCRYGFLLREDGGVLDDLILYRSGPEEFMLVVNAGTRMKDLEWILARKAAGTNVRDATETMGKLDIQGPKSPGLLSGLLGRDLSGIPYFGFLRMEWDGTPVIVSRSGYTGEDGYELYLPADTVARTWDRLLELGVKPAGLGARDTLRLEAGLPLYGHELTEDVSPVEAGMERYLKRHVSYVGAEAVRAKLDAGTRMKLVAFRIDGRQSARNGNPVLSAGGKIGWVTSGSFAPSLGYAIGFAYIETECLRSLKEFAIDLGRRQINATITQAPFYRRMRGGAGN